MIINDSIFCNENLNLGYLQSWTKYLQTLLRFNTISELHFYHENMSRLTNFQTTLAAQKCPYPELFWSAFFQHFPTFGLNTERYGVFSGEYKFGTKSCPNCSRAVFMKRFQFFRVSVYFRRSKN